MVPLKRLARDCLIYLFPVEVYVHTVNCRLISYIGLRIHRYMKETNHCGGPWPVGWNRYHLKYPTSGIWTVPLKLFLCHQLTEGGKVCIREY
jgi:hypothetical protein